MTDNKEVFDQVTALMAAAPEINNPTNDNGKVPFMVVPANTRTEDLSKFFPPQRIKQNVTLLECGSFIDYVKRFKTPATLIFADVGEDSATFRALLDYHESAENDLAPGHCDHAAVFSTIKTVEFKKWLDANRREMTQVQFATFLEDNAKMFEAPTGAALLELVQTLHGKQDVTFSKAVRLSDGSNSINYSEQIEVRGQSSTTAEDKMELPKEITAVFPVFQGSAPYRVRARLKVRVNGQKLVLWYETIDLHLIVRDAVLAIVQDIARSPVAPAAPVDSASPETLLRPGTGIVPLLGRAC